MATAYPCDRANVLMAMMPSSDVGNDWSSEGSGSKYDSTVGRATEGGVSNGWVPGSGSELGGRVGLGIAVGAGRDVVVRRHR